jgi:hypothetical protein
MKRIFPLLATMLLPLGAAAQSVEDMTEAVYVHETQYAVVLHTATAELEWLDDEGRSRIESLGCGVPQDLAEGLWLVTRNPSNEVALIAPSVTPIKPGGVSEIRLSDCALAASAGTLGLDSRTLDALIDSTGVIYIRR